MLGRKGLHRDVLLRLVAESGGADARSVLTTGNLVFTTPEAGLNDAIVRMEQAIARVVGREEPVIVRGMEWLLDFVSHDPFTTEQTAHDECEVAFLSHKLPPLDPRAIPPSGRTKIIAVQARELVAARPRSGGNRPHVNTLLERATGSLATARAWATLVRIARHG